MGKAARNERHKLLATFLNNLAVASIVTGLIVPFLSVFLNSNPDGPVVEVTSTQIKVVLISVSVSAAIAALLRYIAASAIEKIED